MFNVFRVDVETQFQYQTPGMAGSDNYWANSGANKFLLPSEKGINPLSVTSEGKFFLLMVKPRRPLRECNISVNKSSGRRFGYTSASMPDKLCPCQRTQNDSETVVRNASRILETGFLYIKQFNIRAYASYVLLIHYISRNKSSNGSAGTIYPPCQ